MTNTKIPDTKNKGAFFILLAAILWSFGGVCAKFIPLNPLAIVALRGLLGAVAIGCYTGKWIVRLNKITLLSAFCTVGTSVLFMIANKLTTAANAIALQYTSPVFLIMMSLVFLKKKPKFIDIAAVIVILGGIFLFFLDHLGQGALLGNVLSAISGVFFAGVFFLNSLPEAKPEEAAYLGCLFNIFWLPAVLFDPNIANLTISTWGIIIFSGLFQIGFAYMAFSKGIKTTPPVAATIISTIEPILNPVWVFLILGEQPGRFAIYGAAVVILTAAGYNILHLKLSGNMQKNSRCVKGEDKSGKILSFEK